MYVYMFLPAARFEITEEEHTEDAFLVIKQNLFQNGTDMFSRLSVIETLSKNALLLTKFSSGSKFFSNELHCSPLDRLRSRPGSRQTM